MKCTYCQSNPGTKLTGVWCGFRDADTGDLVCWSCRHRHYQAKAKGPHAGLYSELPVMTFNPQLRLAL